MIKKNTWVRIHRILLEPKDRASHIPEDTKQTPLEMWTKGYLLNDANIGDEVQIKTITGRIEQGTLESVNPAYMHNYGDFVPEILKIDEIVLKTLYGEDHE
ncbi:MAG: 2-amino-4-oxopentanoate thiolase subunit OrtA [Bacilli bacterium]|nr:2-amino-4-oxopentanoate thiolase subunit OrtA [Bacilli bacterium]